MHLELLDSLSLSGDPAKPNEDSFAATGRMAVVFDGATGLGEQLMPGASDAHWLAQFAARRLRAHSDMNERSSRDWLRAAAADAAKSFAALRHRAPQEQYEVPFASLMLVALAGEQLHLMWFGDCAALLRATSGFAVVGEAMTKRESERARVAKLVKNGKGAAAAGPGPGPGPAAAGVREEFLPALRASRNRVNAGDEWLFAPDPACADHAKEAEAAVAPGARVLIASDGFLALASDYQRYTPEELFAAACTRGLAGLGEELRKVEASDPDGLRYPRFKRSDDATALLLRVSP